MVKKLYILLIIFIPLTCLKAQLKTGNNPGVLNASAVFEAESTNKGFLIPRMTTAEMNAIASPALGLMIYNTDLNCLHFYFSGWKSQCDPANVGAWSLLGNTGINPATNFLGTTDAQPLIFRTNNTERLRILSGGNIGINLSNPSYKLDIDAQTGSSGDPLRLLGLNMGATTDSLLTSASGVVRRMSFSDYLANANGLTGSGVATRVAFWNGTNSLSSNANLYWDNTNSRLGIGTATPSVQLDVVGRANILTASDFNLFINAGNTTTTGTYNTGIGLSSLGNLTSGSNNVAFVGLGANTTGSYNTAFGGLNANTIGSSNAAFGGGSLLANTIGTHNAAFGTSALEGNIDGTHNTAIGNYALSGVTNGSNNIGLGWGAGDNLTTGSDNIMIGFQIKAPSATGSGQLNIGNLLYGTSLGTGTTPSTGNIGIGTTTPVTKLDVVSSALTTTPTMNVTSTTAGINENIGTNYRNFSGAYFGYIGTAPAGSGGGQGAAIIAGNDKSITFYTGANAGAPGNAWNPTSTENVPRMTILQYTGNVGIGIMAPQYKLDIDARTGSAGNPLRLLGLNAGAVTDSVLTSASGVVRRLSIADIVSAGSNAWSLLGNGGTTAGTNFLGTTDAQDLVFKTNNTEDIRIKSGGNVGIGSNNPDRKLVVEQTGDGVAFVSAASLNLNRFESISNSSSVGFHLKTKNASAVTQEVTIGINPTYYSGTGGLTITDGSGVQYFNIDLANRHIIANEYGGNFGIGRTSPAYKLDIVGSNPMRLIGLNAGATTDSILTSASGVVRRMSMNSMAWGLTGNSGTVDGTNFLGTTDNIPLSFRVNNQRAGRIDNTLANAFFGYQAGNVNSTGFENVFVGSYAGSSNTTGYHNDAFGTEALQNNTTGQHSLAIGYQALRLQSFNNGGANWIANNVAVGNYALYNNQPTAITNGISNTAIGTNALINNTTGASNTALGYRAGDSNITGSNNTLIGIDADVSTSALNNATALGNGAVVDASNKIRLGNASVTLVETYGSFVTISDKRLKKNITGNNIGLNFIKDLRPVHYELKDTAHKGIIYDGFIAQEIDTILKKHNTTFSGLSKPANTEGGHYTVNYATFVVPLVNAVKELDKKNEETAKENADLRAELEKIKAENEALKISVEKNHQDIEAIKTMLSKRQN